jgi:hypothetical protein
MGRSEMKRFRFSTMETTDLSELDIDLAISCLGYETRAVKVAEKFFDSAKRKVAIGFCRQKVLSFHDNRNYFIKAGFEVFDDISDERFQSVVESLLDIPMQDKYSGPRRIVVDISCFDRYRLAVLCQSLLDQVHRNQVEIWFCYNIAAYDPPESNFSINAKLQPVHPSYVGTRPDPLAGTTAIIGLGYEREKALGAAEYLEANEVFTYCPISQIEEYRASVEDANELLLSQLASDHRFVYSVDHPAKLVSELSSVVKGIMLRSSIIMIPLGPKMFALCCLLTATMFPDVSVWRMSQGGATTPSDRRPTEFFSVLRISD